MINENKIKLNANGGPIVFLGSMNAMPMMYALELKKKGFEVIYFVDAPVYDKLCRPENHFSDIEYPYPDWIVEINLKTQMLLPFFRILFSAYLDWKINKRSNKRPQVYVLNGFFISLSSFLGSGIPKIALSHGSDLDSWADVGGAATLANNFCGFSIFKFFPKILSKLLIKYVVVKQFNGFVESNKVVYFPYGFNAAGDLVIDALRKKGVHCYERYDISFEPLKNQNRSFNCSNNRLVVFSGVRFTYKTFSEGNADYNKGNDIIISGLAKYYQYNKNMEIHFVEKGPDVDDAKRLCKEFGLEHAVIWHKEMRFIELLDLYQKSDICFDQLGSHWIGAIGAYAMYLGKPLIANDNLPVKVGIWPRNNPICSAVTAEEVFNQLKRLQDINERERLSNESKRFVECYMSPNKLLNDLFAFESVGG